MIVVLKNHIGNEIAVRLSKVFVGYIRVAKAHLVPVIRGIDDISIKINMNRGVEASDENFTDLDSVDWLEFNKSTDFDSYYDEGYIEIDNTGDITATILLNDFKYTGEVSLETL